MAAYILRKFSYNWVVHVSTINYHNKSLQEAVDNTLTAIFSCNTLITKSPIAHINVAKMTNDKWRGVKSSPEGNNLSKGVNDSGLLNTYKILIKNYTMASKLHPSIYLKCIGFN